MTSLARFIVDINYSFLQTRMLTRANIINVVSTKTEPVDKVSKEGPAKVALV